MRGFNEPMSEECFWLSLNPDRLHAIERAIVEKVVIPRRIEETYLTDDFEIILGNDEIIGLEKVWRERRKIAAKQGNMLRDPVNFDSYDEL